LRVLFLGKDGQLGRALQRAWHSPQHSSDEVCALGRHEADLTDPSDLKRTLLGQQPEVIVNAAAFTAVDRAEAQPAQAHAVNAIAPGVLADYAAKIGALLVHFGTDYVFDGRGVHRWRESDELAPLSVYGATKAEGERRIAATGCRHLILRTSWVYSPSGDNFLTKILRLSVERDQLPVVDDQWGAPTSAEWLAELTVQAVGQTATRSVPSGVYHCVPDGETTWYRHACLLLAEARALGWESRLTPERIRPVITADFPSPAQRPLNSRLDTQKWRETFGLIPPDWREGVRQSVAQFLQQFRS
jgi:dTDP-4-dehydrorhamnose reductase